MPNHKAIAAFVPVSDSISVFNRKSITIVINGIMKGKVIIFCNTPLSKQIYAGINATSKVIIRKQSSEKTVKTPQYFFRPLWEKFVMAMGNSYASATKKRGQQLQKRHIRMMCVNNFITVLFDNFYRFKKSVDIPFVAF